MKVLCRLFVAFGYHKHGDEGWKKLGSPLHLTVLHSLTLSCPTEEAKEVQQGSAVMVCALSVANCFQQLWVCVITVVFLPAQ